MRTFAADFRWMLVIQRKSVAKFASLAQLARARDL